MTQRTTLPEGQEDAIRKPYHEAWALVLFRLGQLQEAMNAALDLPEEGYGLDLYDWRGRPKAEDVWGNVTDDMGAIGHLLPVYEAMLNSTAPRQVTDALFAMQGTTRERWLREQALASVQAERVARAEPEPCLTVEGGVL